jgi:transcriptional regulator with XRE-family HTH domain
MERVLTKERFVTMKDQETVQKFIELRAQGWSFVRIAAELGVAKSTLTEWSRKFRFEIHNRRALVLDDLQDRILGTVQSRVAGLAEKLGKVENELRQRDLKELTTSQLYSLGASLRRQIERETGPIRMVTPTNAIPKDEYVDEVQEWNP